MSTKDKEVNLAEDVKNLFEGAELSAEMQEKIGTILEATVNAKVKERETQLEEESATKLEEATAANAVELEDTVNKYLDYVITEWMEDNKLAVESGVRVEIAENFMTGIKALFESNYIDVPDGKEDALTTTQGKVDTLESSLHEQIEKVATLKAQIETFKRTEAITEQSEGLTDTQKEKLGTLVEDVDFVDAETFSRKVKIIKESFLKTDADSEDDDKGDKEGGSLNEDTNPMDRYLKVMG